MAWRCSYAGHFRVVRRGPCERAVLHPLEEGLLRGRVLLENYEMVCTHFALSTYYSEFGKIFIFEIVRQGFFGTRPEQDKAVICEWGLPLMLISDRDSKFMGRLRHVQTPGRSKGNQAQPVLDILVDGDPRAQGASSLRPGVLVRRRVSAVGWRSSWKTSYSGDSRMNFIPIPTILTSVFVACTTESCV